MKNVDFLPERYRERDLNRKAALWQYAILLGFGGLLLAATFGQFAIKRSLRASLSELKEPRVNAKLKRERVQLLKEQLGSTEESAALYTYLRHPWPKTQLVARITESLPECVVLEGVEIIEQRPERTSIANESRDGIGDTTPAAVDLAQLRNSYDAMQLVVRVRGTVDDTAALNEYVRQLGTFSLFRDVALGSLQSQTLADESPRSSFELTATVRPGHGQPGGPKRPLAKEDQLALHAIERQTP